MTISENHNIVFSQLIKSCFSFGHKNTILIFLLSMNSDAISVGVINCMTSFLAGFVVFSALGYMAQAQGVSIEDLPTNGK